MTIQIRNVPDEIHRLAKARATFYGMTMSEYILQELEKSLSRPSRRELLDRIAQTAPIELEESVVSLLRSERERH